MSKISDLSDGGVIQGGDTLIAVRSGGNVKVTYGGSTTANIDGGTIDGTVIGGTTAAAGSFTSLTSTGIDVSGTVSADGLTTDDDASNLITLGRFSSSYSYSLLRPSTDSTGIEVRTFGGNPTARFLNDGVAELYKSGSKKLATTSTGIDVTGTVSADGLAVTGTLGNFAVNTEGAIVTLSRPSTSYIRATDAAGSLAFDTGGSNRRMFLANNGDISFYDTAGTSQSLFWDSSAESLGIGTSSVGAKLHVLSGTDNNIAANVSEVRFIGADKAITGEQANLVIQTNDDMAVNKGGSIGLGGRHTTSSTNGGNFAQISGRKENATSANFAGYLAFGTSDSASDIHERMRIDSAGQVGIGTSSPDGTLHVKGDVAQVYIQSNDGQPAQIVFGDVSDASRGRINYDSSDNIIFENNNLTERMRIDGASGNVGIGTDSPLSKLNVKGTQGNWRVDPDSVSGEIQVLATTTANDGFRNFRLRSNESIFETGGIEAMRIDSNQNLLVGKTSVSMAAVGVEVKPFGEVRCTASETQALQLNRLSTDGTIADFRKDGTSVGSIGSRSSGLVVGSGDTGLFYDGGGDRIFPESPSGGTARDAAIDLGTSAARFKDLYLSGGAYLGGTGSANKLDDYEEGTWTPTINSGTISATEATYTKIGNVVTLRANIGDISDNTTATDINISGLPFTASSTNRAVGSSMFRYFSKTNMAQVTPYVGQSRTFIEFYVSFNSNSTWTPLQFDDGAQANMDLIFSITYIA